MSDQVDAGFEIAGEFFKWTVSDNAKDLMLIDRFTQMPANEFFEAISSGMDTGRGPIMLAMMATSMRAKYKAWSVERVTRTVMDLNLSDVEFMNPEDEDEAEEDSPPDGPGEAPATDPAAESGVSSSET